MRTIATLLLFCALRLGAQTTNIVGLEVETNGWVLRVTIGGSVVASFGTNAQFYNGFRPNNAPSSTNKLALTAVSPSFTAAGVSQAVTRTVYATRLLRGLYPMQNTNDFYPQDVLGTNVVGRLGCSDFLFAGEAITATALAGYVVNTNSGVDAAAFTSQSVTNSSTNDWPRVIGQWTIPFHERATGSFFGVRLGAGHFSGIAGVEFRATDGTTTITQLVNEPWVDRLRGDLVPSSEYAWGVPLASLATSNVITVNARVFPNLGTTNCILDTADGLFTRPVDGHCPFKFFNDRALTYTQTWANVSVTNGNDATGIATNYVAWTTNLAPFRTVRGAANAIALRNSNDCARLDVGAGVIYCDAGEYPGMGTNLAAGQVPATYVTITRQPLVPAADVIFFTNWSSAASANGDISDRVKFLEVTLGGIAGGSSGGTVFQAIDYALFEKCIINTFQGNAISFFTNWVVDRCTVTRIRQGLAPASSTHFPPWLVRGSALDMTNSSATCFIPVMVGNRRSLRAGAVLNIRNYDSGQLPKPSTYWAHNFLTQSNSTESPMDITMNNSASWRGVWIANNMFEEVANVTGSMELGVEETNLWNVVIAGNTVLNKVNWFYNAAGAYRVPYGPSWVMNNFMGDANIKGDIFSTSAAADGNQAMINGVGFYNVSMPEIFTIGTAGTFQHEYAGIYGYTTNTTTTNSWPQFTDLKAFTTNTVSATGGGNYRPLSTSPLFAFRPAYGVLRHDIEGAPRGAIDPPGAYVAGNVRKGAFF